LQTGGNLTKFGDYLLAANEKLFLERVLGFQLPTREPFYRGSFVESLDEL
jgi:hypothetical protein